MTIDSSHSSSKFYYQIGGSLSAESATYIVRQADRDFLEALLAKEYCYVLNARQMGKSSLRVHTMSEIKARGIACTEIELLGIGSQQITSQQWYGGIIQEIIDGFDLEIDRRRWWQEREDLSPVQLLGEFIETVLLQQISHDIVIFIDEIDSILSLNFVTDDFLSLIHNFYDKRASQPEYRRLTFALLGVATPRELMQNERTTPFNIGRAIELKGFQLEESIPLTRGFGDRFLNPQEIMARILFWTGGQPFLTQKLCRLVEQNSQVIDLASLDELVKRKIIDNWESQDDPEHLRTIRDRLCRHANRGLVLDNSSSSQELLKIYRRIRRHGKIRSKSRQAHLELQLSGIVASNGGSLIVKNKIYQTVFDLNWVDRQLEELDDRPSNSLSLSRILTVALLVASSITGMRSLGWLETRELKFFDLMMRIRPGEAPDPRLLLVTVTKDDIKAQPIKERGAASISDRSLARLLSKLERSPAKAIGLDIYRDTPLATKYRSASEQVRQSDRFVLACNYGDPGISASSQIIANDGFNNVFLDDDGVIRRHMLAVDEAKPCNNKYSFNWLLAAQYLSTIGIEEEINKDNNLQLGNRPFATLKTNTGGYHQLYSNNNSGNQVLLNCRNTKQIAERVTLSEISNDNFDLDSVGDRIVLIGTTADNFGDTHWRTSCSDRETGVELHAQMVSQILSSTLDNRPLLWSLSEFEETLIIFAGALLTGVLYYYKSSYLQFGRVMAIASVFIFGTGELLLIVEGIWLPILPLLMVLVSLGSSLWIYQRRLEKDR